MVYLLDRNERIKSLPDVWDTHHTQALNRESVLELNSLQAIDKYEHVMYQDSTGTWYEFVVSGVEEQHEQNGALYYRIYAESVLTELTGDWIEDRRIVNQGASVALTRALEGTRWTVGTVDALGNGTVNFYRENAYVALGKIIRTYGCEVQTRIVVTDGRVSARYVDLLIEVGSDTGARFEWSRNILEIKREILRGDVITALHGYGRGAEVGDGFGRRIDFASINNGLDYITDENARRTWGRVGTVKSWESLNDMYPTWQDVANTGYTWGQLYNSVQPGRTHRHGKVEFDELTEPAAVLAATQAAFESLKQPRVSYEASVADLASLVKSGKLSFTWSDVAEKYPDWQDMSAETWDDVEFDESVILSMLPTQLGDHVAVIDDDLGIEIKLRVVQIVRNPLEPLMDEITLGQMPGDYARTAARNERVMSDLRAVHGVTKMVSEDGNSWIDYSVPEIHLDGPDGDLRIDTDVIFQLHDELGNMVAGFTEIGGQKGLFSRFLANTPDGASGIGTIGHGPEGGAGFHFKLHGHTFMLTFDTEFGLQLYVDGVLRQIWWADKGSTIFNHDRSAFMSLHQDGRVESKYLDLGGNGFIFWGANKPEVRFILGANGTNQMRNANNQLVFETDNTKSELICAMNQNQRIGADATGPYYVKNGVKTYF